jgi:hypothetical protein
MGRELEGPDVGFCVLARVALDVGQPRVVVDDDLDEGELVEGAELKGATPLMEFAGEGAMTFTY